MREYTPPSLNQTSTPAVSAREASRRADQSGLHDILGHETTIKLFRSAYQTGKSVRDLVLAGQFMTEDEWDQFELEEGDEE